MSRSCTHQILNRFFELPSGDLAWASTAGGDGQDLAVAVAVDAAGCSYVSGNTGSPNFTLGSTTLTNNTTDGVDLFIAKFGATGNGTWAVGASGASFGSGIALDPSGDVLVTGGFADTTTFGPIELLNTDGHGDAYIARISGVTGIEESGPSDAVTIFPNPFSNETMVMMGDLRGNIELSVENLLGQPLVRYRNVRGQTMILRRGDLAKGAYIVRLISDGRTIATRKIVIVD